MFRPTTIIAAATTLIFAVVALIMTSSHAWVSNTPTTMMPSKTTMPLHAVSSSRQEFFQTIAKNTGLVAVAAALGGVPQPALADSGVTTLPNGVSYVVKKAGNGPLGDIGELVAIRFAAYANGIKLDDLFDNPEPYYTRLGSGGLLKGVEETLPLMRLGDRWVLTIPVRSFFIRCVLAVFCVCTYIVEIVVVVKICKNVITSFWVS
jgi:FKBP-type peptidyl-prolyl cis-trans isomerase